MLGGPAPPRARPVVIGPDQLVEEAFPPEYLIQEQLAVVSLAVVDVKVERAFAGEQTLGMLQAWGEESEIVLEGVAIGALREQARGVATSREAGPVARLIGDGSRQLACLLATRVEGRVDVDQLERFVGEARQHFKTVAEDDFLSRWTVCLAHAWAKAKGDSRRWYGWETRSAVVRISPSRPVITLVHPTAPDYRLGVISTHSSL